MLEGTPSKTALIVAIGLVILGSSGSGKQQQQAVKSCPPLNVIQTQAQLLQACQLPCPTWLLRFPFLAKFICILGHYTIANNLFQGLGMRKMYMENQVRQFINNNNNKSTSTNTTSNKVQVLVVAAGYDTLALRLSQEYPSTHFWEVDHPATSRVKQKGIHQMMMQAQQRLPSNLHFVMADLTTTTIQQALSTTTTSQQQQYYDSTIPTVVILEGLSMYLNEKQLKQLFNDLGKGVVPSQSIVAFDHFGWNATTNRVDNGYMSGSQMWFAKKLGEQWHWGVEPQDLQTFFNQDTTCSWQVTNQYPTKVGLEYMATITLQK